MSASSEFGKDEGVIHEAIVTGRKVGAGQNFWSALAHDEKLFRRTKDFVEKEISMVFVAFQNIPFGMN